jgi:hypothetical protein
MKDNHSKTPDAAAAKPTASLQLIMSSYTQLTLRCCPRRCSCSSQHDSTGHALDEVRSSQSDHSLLNASEPLLQPTARQPLQQQAVRVHHSKIIHAGKCAICKQFHDFILAQQACG